jgi:hypothetical protein
MGGELTMAPQDKAPTFMVYALRDPIGANLDRIQVIKGWVDDRGKTQEKVYDVAWSGDRSPGADGKLPPVGDTVDIEAANWTNTIGGSELATVWTDPDFDADQRAFYYARVLEIPTPRWVLYDKVRFGIELPERAELIHQERAYTLAAKRRAKMNRLMLLALVAAVGLGLSATVQAQDKSLSSTMDVFVFPKEGQDAAQQSKDEVECYEWAVGNVGTDPFDLSKQKEADQQQAQAEQEAAKQTGQGAGARGALRGAAAGALIGEIANDDASEGAAWGAAAGAVRGRRMGREAQAQAQQQTAAQAEQREQATAEQLANFKKAFSVCLEAQDYMVKY